MDCSQTKHKEVTNKYTTSKISTPLKNKLNDYGTNSINSIVDNSTFIKRLVQANQKAK